MKKRTILILPIFLFAAHLAMAGWFTPKPPIQIVNEPIEIKDNSVASIPIIFEERSSYTPYLWFKPKQELQEEESNNIAWGSPFHFQVIFQKGDSVLFQKSFTERLSDSTFGYGLGRLQVPKQLPLSTLMELKIKFEQVDAGFSNKYSGLITIRQSPYIMILY